MENYIENLKRSILKLKDHLKDSGQKYHKELMNDFNHHLIWLDTQFNPTDEWLKDQDFRTIFLNWVKAVSPDNKFNEGRQKAALDQLRDTSDNDKELAVKILINAAIYGTLNFKESGRHIKPSSKPKAIKAEVIKLDRIEIEQQFKIKVIEHTLSILKVKGDLTPVQYAKLEKLTGLKIIVE